ncbi:MAG: hypothetical protein QOK39_1114 [Acidimicrobiaceae bacterium]|nr:hypothetical protein [Acidimicrobiaceae bacterium]
MKINTSVTGNVIAGVIAFAIYWVISLATGAKAAPVIIVAVLLGVTSQRMRHMRIL